jgi:SAM-dependent methyltransferase
MPNHSVIGPIRNLISFLPPPRFTFFYKELRRKAFCLLDVGCGNHSATLTLQWFPCCEYHGIDIANYNNDDDDFAAMKKFYAMDISTDSFEAIPNDYFDVIMLSHILEHTPNGLEVLSRLLPKLRDGGRIYIEYPSERSLSLPSMKGTLNFCDDPTHVRLYDIKDICNTLLSARFRIVRAGRLRTWWKVLFFPIHLIALIPKGTCAGAFWHLLGFAEYVYAVKVKTD